MNIVQNPSPNFDERTLPISLLVLHYTGMQTGASALERMCDKKAKVSAHYMVEEDGAVVQMVAENKRAWHAGVSEWCGESNINSASIGIEIVNGGHDFELPDFPNIQIDAVIALSQGIIQRHKISDMGVVGHSDIAPVRKIDPGEKFPWQKLADNGVGFWPKISDKVDTRGLFTLGDRDRGVAILQSGLAYLGYGVEITGVLDEKTEGVLVALQRRYRPCRMDGKVDVETMEIITHLANHKKTEAQPL